MGGSGLLAYYKSSYYVFVTRLAHCSDAEARRRAAAPLARLLNGAALWLPSSGTFGGDQISPGHVPLDPPGESHNWLDALMGGRGASGAVADEMGPLLRATAAQLAARDLMAAKELLPTLLDVCEGKHTHPTPS
eukprot:1183652-Prorocentrum_minimum.AAC.1